MRTRSQTKSEDNSKTTEYQTQEIPEQKYIVDIDFDGASKAWLANKKRQPNATYKYICLGKTKNGRNCNRTPIEHTNYCTCHGK